MKLELQNIGGFTGVHTFELKKGINRITAPNAMGKSSLLRGIECLASDDEGMLRDTLNADNDAGYIKLGDEYVRHLRRVSDAIVQADAAEDRTFSQWQNAEKIAFFTPKSRVVQKIMMGTFDVLRFVDSISRAEVIEHDIRRNENQLDGKKRELEEYIENLKSAQKLDAEIGTMRGEIQKLQGEVQKLEGEIEKEIGTRDLTNVCEDIASKKQEIRDLEERVRSREGEVRRYQDQYEKAQALYERLTEDIINFEEISKTDGTEELDRKLHLHTRRKKDMKTVRDMLDDLWSVVDKAYKICGKEARVLPDRVKAEPLLDRASTLLGKTDKCPVCNGNVDCRVLNDRRKELRECITDFAKAMRGEDEDMKIIKGDLDEIKRGTEDITSKRRERDKAKREASDLLKELEDRKNLCGDVDSEIAERVHDLKILEQQYEDAAKTVKTESRDRLNKVREKIGGYENEVRNNQKEIDRLTHEIPDYTIGESLEDYATKKRRTLDNLRSEIEELKDEYEHEAFGTVDLFNANINDIYHQMGFTTFRKIEIVKRIMPGKLSSLDVVVEHESGKKQSLSSLNETEKLTIGLVSQIAAKYLYIPDFPFFVIDDNMRTYDPEQYHSIIRYLESNVDYVLISQLVPRSEQKELVVKYGSG